MTQFQPGDIVYNASGVYHVTSPRQFYVGYVFDVSPSHGIRVITLYSIDTDSLLRILHMQASTAKMMDIRTKVHDFFNLDKQYLKENLSEHFRIQHRIHNFWVSPTQFKKITPYNYEEAFDEMHLLRLNFHEIGKHPVFQNDVTRIKEEYLQYMKSYFLNFASSQKPFEKAIITPISW